MIEFAKDKLSWLDGDTVRPYVYVREDNRTYDPGTRFDSDWFDMEPLYLDPLRMDQVKFADQILVMERKAFTETNMAMPRWVFYDCAVMPGFVAGFAHRTDKLDPEVKKALDVNGDLEWTPISLFISIPARSAGEWIAHNLSSVNALISKEKRFYGLGFLSKAFALWQANIGNLCGMTQWESPAKRLHSYYGAFQVLTAYTPVHSYPRTLTYRSIVDPAYWALFFTKDEPEDFVVKYHEAGFSVDPKDVDSLKSMQRRIEAGEGPFFLNPLEIRTKRPEEILNVYKPRS